MTWKLRNKKRMRDDDGEEQTEGEAVPVAPRCYLTAGAQKLFVLATLKKKRLGEIPGTRVPATTPKKVPTKGS